MTRDEAIAAYNRVKAWEQSVAKRLRESILLPFFGGCGCRMHNCTVAYERGVDEGTTERDGVVYSHRDMVKLAKRYYYEQNKAWRTAERLQAAFASRF